MQNKLTSEMSNSGSNPSENFYIV